MWSIVFLSFMSVHVLSNVYILSAIMRIRWRLERVHYNLIFIFLSLNICKSFVANITTALMLSLHEELRNIMWLCKTIVISNKITIILGPTTVLVAYIWITLQFVFLFRARSWSNTSTIRYSFFTMWTIVTVVYGLPAAVDPHVEQCLQSMTFPNWYHGLAVLYTLFLPYMFILLVAHVIVYRKAAAVTLNQPFRQSSLTQQRQMNNLKSLNRSFSLICVISILKIIAIMAYTNYALFFNRSSINNDLYFQVIITFSVNIHVLVLPCCMYRSKKVSLYLKLIILHDFHRLTNVMKQNYDETTNECFNSSGEKSMRSIRSFTTPDEQTQVNNPR